LFDGIADGQGDYGTPSPVKIFSVDSFQMDIEQNSRSQEANDQSKPNPSAGSAGGSAHIFRGIIFPDHPGMLSVEPGEGKGNDGSTSGKSAGWL
jgi:hypothetical protein